MKRTGVTTRIAKLREENKKAARRVANRLLGVRKFNVLNESAKHPTGWKVVKQFPSFEEAEQFVYLPSNKRLRQCIEEKC